MGQETVLIAKFCSLSLPEHNPSINNANLLFWDISLHNKPDQCPLHSIHFKTTINGKPKNKLYIYQAVKLIWVLFLVSS